MSGQYAISTRAFAITGRTRAARLDTGASSIAESLAAGDVKPRVVFNDSRASDPRVWKSHNLVLVPPHGK
jgi:hypothetical protein